MACCVVYRFLADPIQVGRRQVFQPGWCSFHAVVALAIVLLTYAAPGRAAAQVLYGSIVGDVKDSSGAAMPGATVLVTNNNTGFKREAVTDGVGHFNLFDLPVHLRRVLTAVCRLE